MAACPLCAAHDAKPTRTRADRYDVLFPWVATLTVAVVVASLGIASEQWFGIGAVAGILAGGAVATLNVRRAVGMERADHGHAIAALQEESDTRVETVIRQFEWAITDLATLRRDQDRAQVTADLLLVQGRARERHIQKLERRLAEAQGRIERLAAIAAAADRTALDAGDAAADATLPFRWGIHLDGDTTRLELEVDDRHGASRVRVIDRAGITKMKSMTAMHTGAGSLSFALADPPEELVADLEAGREPGHRLQALCDGEWRPIRLEDTGRRTRIVSDKQGHIYRVSDFAIELHRSEASFEPYDAAADTMYLTL